MDKIEKSISETRKSFEKSFREGQFYHKQTADDQHLNLLMGMVDPRKEETILDLGTGNGYVAFALADYCLGCNIIGLDIVKETLDRNSRKAREESKNHLQFLSYDGRSYPFMDESIDTAVTRYALHHFPNIEESLKELYRVLKKNGKLVIADPVPNENDTVGFIDEFMDRKRDGHVRFYSFEELDHMLAKAGFRFKTKKDTSIRFPRKNPEEYEYLFTKYKSHIWQGYGMEVMDDEIWIKEQVVNLVYYKK